MFRAKAVSTLVPNISSTDSLISSIPDLTINNDNKTPTYASKLICQTKSIIAHTKTEIDKSASLNASEPLATSESELTSLPFCFTYNPNVNFTTIPAIIMIRVAFV